MKLRDQRHAAAPRASRASTRRDRIAERARTSLRARADRGDRWLVAVESFTADFNGEPVAITAGRDLVRSTHEIARRHRELFAPALEGLHR